ncbi:MAG: hypothetical protein ACFNUU_03440 [Campylobacter sp.]|uniref:hypothetical protein n=1 Tax=Campylobacter sp. TaxID=205 RepID=UPI003623BBB1
MTRGGCFTSEIRRAVFGVKFDAYRVRVFCVGCGCACCQNLRVKSLGKIYAFASNLAAHAYKFENIRAYRKFSAQILKFAS